MDAQTLGVKLRKEEMESFNQAWRMGNDLADGKPRRFDGI